MWCSGLLILVTLNAAQIFAQTSAPQPTAEKAHLEGQITNIAGEPLKKAAVRLQGNFASTRPANGGGPVMPTSYTSESDAAGHFVFEEVEPGRYTLSAERAGYVRTTYGARSNSSPATPVVLSAGQKMTGIGIKLIAQGVISGKITDEDGDPVGRAQVMISQARYQNGRRMLVPAGNAANTLADGTFLVTGLAAGRYYLSATDLQSTMINGQNELPGRKGPEESYVTTYYPNGTELASAVPIDVASGAEVRGIEIRLQKARVFRVSGKVAIAAGANVALQLIPQNSIDVLGMISARNMSMVRGDGSFDFRGVLPGTYTIRSQILRPNNDTGPATPLYSRQVVSVSNANLDNVEVQLIAGGEIAGKITIEGQDQQQKQRNDAAQAAASGTQSPTARPMVILIPLQPGLGSNGANAQSNDDGTFRIKNIGPDNYRVNVTGLPSGTWVKSVRFGGQDISNSSLDATSGGSGQLDIVLSPDAASLSGIARNSKGETMAGVTVSLWETATANTPPETILNRVVVTDQNGNFQLKNLPPGDYHVAAWETYDSYFQDPQFRAKFESQAATVKLAASAQGNVDAPTVSQEAIEVEAAKLR